MSDIFRKKQKCRV